MVRTNFSGREIASVLNEFGYKRVGRVGSHLIAISFAGTELASELSLTLSDGLRLVYNTAKSVPVTATIGWEGSVRDGGVLTDNPVWRLLPVPDGTIVTITESAELRTIAFGGSQ